MRACRAESSLYTYFRFKDIHKYTQPNALQPILYRTLEPGQRARDRDREREAAYDYIYLNMNSIWLNCLFMWLVVTRLCHIILLVSFAIGFRIMLMLHRKNACRLCLGHGACLFIVFSVPLKVEFLTVELANGRHVIVMLNVR